MSKVICVYLLLIPLTWADTGRYRIVWENTPESEALIIWDQFSGTNPKIHYSILDHGQNTANYENSKSPDSSLSFKSMSNQFAKISGLQADTNYYFVISDSQGVSERMYFRTAAATKKPFKFIQGGDSRNNRGARQDGNLLVAKLRPLFVSFGGDMINSGSDSEWQNWFDDWQLTIADDGRVTPIVPIRGNHESSDHIPNLFGITNSEVYYKISVNDNLFCQYLLNSEINTFGTQKTWLNTELENSFSSITFLSASYHKPMRPHVSSKSEGNHVYDAWAQLFYDYKFDILAENDSHCVKRTVAVKPSSAAGSDEGFIAASDGFIKIGEGTWGAPLRSADDAKNWTLDSGSFNSFDLLHVYTDKIEVRTIKFENQSSVGSLSELDDVFELPANLNVWQANGGAVQTVLPKNRTGVNPVNYVAFEFGSEWKYYDEISAPPANWKDVNFDDTTWQSGKGQFGYGDGDENTVLDYGGDSSNKTISYYFRKNFSLSSVNDESEMRFDILYDDAAIVYVNGQEVKRINMPTGTITHTTTAASSASDNSLATVVIASSLLSAGDNTLCVEVHNRSKTSSDISFDGGLTSNQDNIGSKVQLISEKGSFNIQQPDSATWHYVSLNKTYQNPVVIFSALTTNGGQAAHIRVRNASGNSFEWKIEEWDYLDGYHIAESVDYIVLEAGTYNLPDGSKFEAGSVAASDSYTTHAFKSAFQSTPVVVTQLASAQDLTAAAVRLNNINSSSFDLKLQSEEAKGKVHGDEIVSYIAVQNANYAAAQLLEAGSTGISVDHNWFNLQFSGNYQAAPSVFASFQTTRGGDTLDLRIQSLTSTGVQVKVHEEQSKDTETNHTKEKLGYILFNLK